MNDEQYHFFHNWFRQFVLTFRETDPLHQRNLDIKEEHTYRVCSVADRISSSLGLAEDDRRLAFITALFHDIGRFPQYQKYRTFRDPDSANHAKLSLWELNRHHVLNTLDSTERRIINRAVYFHNQLHVPDGQDPKSTLHCRLIRDADKIDILGVMVEHFQTAAPLRNQVVTLGLEEDHLVREEIYRLLFERRTMSYTMLRTTDELKVLQMSWVFDINFPATLEIMRERNYLAQLAATMHDTTILREALAFVGGYIDQRLKLR